MKIKLTLKTAVTIAILTSLNANSSVYVTYDTVQPTSAQRLKNAQIKTQEAQTKAILRSVESNEYMFAKLAELNTEQEARNQYRIDNVVQQRIALDKAREKHIEQANTLYERELELVRKDKANKQYLLTTKAKIEEQLSKERINIEQQRNNMYAQNIQDQQVFSEKQFRAQDNLLAMQKTIGNSQDQLLEVQLRQSAPSNLIVVSKTANNLKQEVRPSDALKIGEFSETGQKQKSVNMNQFISTIIPTGWKYLPPSDFQNERMSLVTGTDWKSIVNQIAIQHPYIEFVINPYDKTLIAKELNRARIHHKDDTIRTWAITPQLSLRGNIESFSEQAEWTLIWDTQNVDYPIVANAVLRGNFAGRDGVVNKLMASTQSEDFPLIAHWKLQNKVVIIKRKGAKIK